MSPINCDMGPINDLFDETYLLVEVEYSEVWITSPVYKYNVVC